MSMDPTRRLNALVDLATPREFPSMRISIEKYIQILNDIFQMGTYYAGQGDEEKAFILFLRFVSIAVEELPNHGVFSSISTAEQISIDAKIIEAMAKAEFFKSNIRRRYENEALLAIKKEEEAAAPSTSAESDSKISFNPSLTLAEWGISEEKLLPYTLCNEASVHPIVFQRVIIPNNLPQSFLKSAGGPFKFAFLYGKLVRNSLIASHLLISPAEHINPKKLEKLRFVSDKEAETDMKPIIGCISSSLSDVCATRFFEYCQLSEMICIICPAGPHRSFVLHLVNMPANYRSNHMRDLNFSGCAHLHITDQVSPTLVDNDSFPGAMSA